MLRNLCLAVALAGASTAAVSMPLVYQCRIIDYTAEGAVVTEFQYTYVGRAVNFESMLSRAHVYLDEDRRLVMSLRPLADPQNYASVTGFDMPRRMQVVKAVQSDYAALLECVL